MSDPKKVLQISNLKKNYGSVEVLHDINIEMEEAEFLVLLGPSGCGKSTLLNCIAGLETINEGAIKIGGKDMTQTPPGERDIAMVFQSYALYPTMSVGENITFGLKVRGTAKKEQQKQLQRVAEILQLDQLLDRKPSALSGGQRQRVAMGRALVRNPKLYLFDEPLSNLDAKLRVEMRAEIKSLHQRVNASIVYVTHDQIEAMTLATRICILKDGHIQQIGTPDEVYYKPANTYVAGFMGSPPMNLLPVVSKGADKISIAGDDSQLSKADLSFDGVAILGIRPEEIRVVAKDKGMLSQPVTATAIERTGSDTYITAKVGEHSFTIREAARKRVEVGDQFNIDFDQDAISLFDAKSGLRLN
ncbi:ABC transporter ATP-binding protein [uncultured Maritalea sp.]|uniref:ABC transporter ATP-binding protein n=1 Tax=uncultured Maritalea sp. TaxID=757249 RepID=UPI0026340CC1|nr:ABC transporter ATP-binding protein [uncultured Maritalea sp.]